MGDKKQQLGFALETEDLHKKQLSMSSVRNGRLNKTLGIYLDF